MGIVTARVVQTSTIANKIITLHGEGFLSIGPSQTLFLDTTVQDKLLVKNLTPEDVQTGFSDGHVVDQQLERKGNFTDEE